MSAEVPARPLKATLGLRLLITVDTQPLADSEAAIRGQIQANNRMRRNHDLDELQSLSRTCLNEEEVLLFLELLAAQPPATLELLRKHPLNLEQPELKLYSADGLGLKGLRAGFRLHFANGAWRIEPELFAADVLTDLEVATRAERERQAAHEAALNEVFKKTPRAAGAEMQAAARLRGAQRAKLDLLGQLEKLLPKAGTLGGYDAASLKAERARLDAALLYAPEPSVGMSAF
jgi:hypothetical protein